MSVLTQIHCTQLHVYSILPHTHSSTYTKHTLCPELIPSSVRHTVTDRHTKIKWHTSYELRMKNVCIPSRPTVPMHNWHGKYLGEQTHTHTAQSSAHTLSRRGDAHWRNTEMSVEWVTYCIDSVKSTWITQGLKHVHVYEEKRHGYACSGSSCINHHQIYTSRRQMNSK